MFQLNKAVEYAILLLLSLTKSKDKPLSLKKIAEKKNLPLKYLERIASQLKEKNLLQSREGVKGGYLLAKPSEEISLLEIIHAIEEKQGLVSCIYGLCPLEKECFHKKVWQKLQRILEKELEKIKLSDLVG